MEVNTLTWYKYYEKGAGDTINSCVMLHRALNFKDSDKGLLSFLSFSKNTYSIWLIKRTKLGLEMKEETEETCFRKRIQ